MDEEGVVAARLGNMVRAPIFAHGRAWAWRRGAVVALLAVGLLAGCTSDDDGSTGSNSAATGSAVADLAETDSAGNSSVADSGATDSEAIESDATVLDSGQSDSDAAVSASSESDPESGFWRATEVVDGDTLYVVGPGGELKVRVLGINTPESGECFSEEATDALEDLVADADLVLVTDQTDLDQFERSLRYVETAEGLDVGAVLVAGGYAISRRYEPDVARDALYSDLQATARRDRVGLWAPDACGDPVVEGMVIEIDVNADAPGDDSENLNGEWVRFTSVADKPIDLDDWEVADESASHRYSFDEFVLDPGRSVTLYTGCGDDDDEEVFWCVGGSAVWNNAGDTVFLRDPNGNLVAVFAYGESA
jgi:endonuclease YncB( thermonuclease family)